MVYTVKHVNVHAYRNIEVASITLAALQTLPVFVPVPHASQSKFSLSLTAVCIGTTSFADNIDFLTARCPKPRRCKKIMLQHYMSC